MRRSAWLLLAGILFVAPNGSGKAGPSPLLPDIVPLPPEGVSIGRDNELRFSTVVTNQGEGPLELEGPGIDDPDHQPTPAFQNVYDTEGGHTSSPAGQFVWHETHHHWHFLPELALYELRRPDKNGSWQDGKVAVSGKKATFCFLDLRQVRPDLPGSPPSRVYELCGTGIQGISVGWGDVYSSFLPDQFIDLKHVVNGIYWLVITADPQHALLQLTTENDYGVVRIRLSKRGKRRTVVVMPP